MSPLRVIRRYSHPSKLPVEITVWQKPGKLLLPAPRPRGYTRGLLVAYAGTVKLMVPQFKRRLRVFHMTFDRVRAEISRREQDAEVLSQLPSQRTNNPNSPAPRRRVG